MAIYLLDCNHLSAALRKVSLVRERIHQERKSGGRFVSCIPVLCELEAGIQQTAQPAVAGLVNSYATFGCGNSTETRRERSA